MAIDPDIDFSIDRPENGGDYTEIVANESPAVEHYSAFGSTDLGIGVSVIEGTPFWCDWEKRHDAMRRFLGYSTVRDIQGANGKELHRQLPVRCPDANWMFCVGADIQGVKFKGVSDEGPEDSPPFATYERAKVTLKYAQLPFRLREDDEIQGEQDRYIYRTAEPLVDITSADKGKMTFVEGPYTGDSVGQVSIIVPKKRVKLVWYQVPAGFIYKSDDGLTLPNLDRCIGKVNKSKFLGCPPGTLLMEAPDLSEVYVVPVPTKGDTDPTFYLNVKLNMVFFDPPFDDSLPVPSDEDLYKYRGHNLASGPNKLFYAIQSFPETEGGPRYPTYDADDFDRVFEAAD